MTLVQASVNGSRKSLASQIDRLDSILDGLSEGLNEAVADAVQRGVGQATREAVRGALFIVFNVDGDPYKAYGYFKNVNGQVIDDFTITSQPDQTGSTATPPPPPTATSASMQRIVNGSFETDTDSNGVRYSA